MAVARTWAAAGCLLALFAGAVAAGRAGDGMPGEYAPLLTAARQVLATRAVALVDGAAPSGHEPLAAGTVIRSPRFVATEESALRGLTARREQLRASGEIFLAADTGVRFLAARTSGERLELRIAEHTTLYRGRVRGDEPETTAYEAGRTVAFTRAGGRWTLVEVSLDGAGPPPVTEPDATDPADLIGPRGGFAEFD